MKDDNKLREEAEKFYYKHRHESTLKIMLDFHKSQMESDADKFTLTKRQLEVVTLLCDMAMSDLQNNASCYVSEYKNDIIGLISKIKNR